MNDRKEIDRLYQEKFEGFEATPPADLWLSIEEKLSKKKRRIVPFWWLYGGVAAIVIIGLLIYPLTKSTDSVNPINIEPTEVIVTSPTKDPSLENQKNEIQKDNVPATNSDTMDSFDEVLVETNTKKKKQTNTKHRNIAIAPVEKTTTDNLVAHGNNVSDKIREGVLSDSKKAMKKIFKETEDEEIAQVAKNNSDKESTPIASGKRDFIAAVNKTKKTASNKNNEQNKWSVAPIFALTKASSLTDTSPIDKTLTSSATEGTSNFAYGVKVAYQMKNNWAIQSGLFVNKLGYTNNNLSVSSLTRTGNTLQGVAYNTDQSFMILNTPDPLSEASDLDVTDSFVNDGMLSQSYNYIEIPIEVAYTFLESNKFSSRVVTGFSSLFLNKNEITIQTQNQTTNLGKAKDLNTLNFSGNLGLDLQYSINDKLQFAINPMFKVQLNTFSQNSNGFKPYTIGIYSGIIYKF